MIYLLYIVGLLLLVGADQWTKYLAVLHLKGQENVVLWQGVFELEYRENYGAAFSIMQGKRWFLIGFTALALILLFVFLLRMRVRHRHIMLTAGTLILAGGVGNLIDRIVHGYVVDFLYFSLIDFPVFNVADCCVVTGSLLLMVYILFFYRDNVNRAGEEAKSLDTDDAERTAGGGGNTAG